MKLETKQGEPCGSLSVECLVLKKDLPLLYWYGAASGQRSYWLAFQHWRKGLRTAPSQFTLPFSESLFYFHIRLSVKWTSPHSVVNRNNLGLPLIVWGEGGYPVEAWEGEAFLLFIVLLLIHLIPVNKVGCLGKEHTHPCTIIPIYLQLFVSLTAMRQWASVLVWALGGVHAKEEGRLQHLGCWRLSRGGKGPGTHPSGAVLT